MAAARGTSTLRGRLTLVGINYFSFMRRSSSTSASFLWESVSHDTLWPLMMPTELAVGLEPLNALDAAHRSPRSVPHLWIEVCSPAGSTTRRSIKRNKELLGSSD